MSRPGVLSALRANSPYAVEAVNSVVDAFFGVDADGLVFAGPEV
jgi:hypothetical protein